MLQVFYVVRLGAKPRALGTGKRDVAVKAHWGRACPHPLISAPECHPRRERARGGDQGKDRWAQRWGQSARVGQDGVGRGWAARASDTRVRLDVQALAMPLNFITHAALVIMPLLLYLLKKVTILSIKNIYTTLLNKYK
jgi:hypothetical protein